MKRYNLSDGTGVLAEVAGFGITTACHVTIPTDGTAGYATGCIFHHLDGAAGSSFYINEGTKTSCDFNPITAAADISTKADKVGSATSGHLAGLDGSGNLTDSAIAAADVLLRTGGVALTGDLPAGTHKITGLGTPSAATDAATKAYVDTIAAGLDFKGSVRAATTANGTLASAYENGDTLDGITLATGDRILLKNQTTGSENGIYTVNASGAPTRASDMAAASSAAGAFVVVEEGTAGADKVFVCTSNVGSDVVGTNSLAWSSFGITDISTKADKVGSPTTGHFAGLDVNGNLTDSGSKAADFANASHSHAGSDITSGTVALARGGFGADVSAYDGFPRIASGAASNIKCKFNGTTAPTVSDDGTAGYAVGSRWLDTTNAKEYVCLATATGAAVWKETSPVSTDVAGPASATDNAIARFDGTGGKTIQNSGLIIDDNDRLTFKASDSAITSVADGATITFDLNTSNFFTTTLGGNRTLAISNGATGQRFAVIIIQDASTRTVTWWANIKWAGGAAPTLSTAGNKIDMFVFLKRASDYLGAVVGQNFA